MRREPAYAHRNSASCTNTPGTHLVHMATGPPQQPLETQPQKRGVCKRLGFTTPRSSLLTITQQQKHEPAVLFCLMFSSSFYPPSFFLIFPSIEGRLKGRVEMFKNMVCGSKNLTDNNKRFTLSRNSKNLRRETQRQYLAVKEWRSLQHAKSLPLCPRSFDPKLPVSLLLSLFALIRIY